MLVAILSAASTVYGQATYQVVTAFDMPGTNPYAGLIQASDGNFYGTTLYGGASGYGTVFKMDAAGTLTTLHSFNQSDGANPYARLIQASDGNLYGTALGGGPKGGGVVFRVTHAPVAANDAYSTNLNTPRTIPAPGVLSNDVDVDHDDLTAMVVSSPAHGTVTLNANGSFTYTPAANYSGPDSFTYKANDGTADSNVATVSITVTAPVVTLGPSTFAFGNQLVGTTSAVQTVTLSNTGNGSLTIKTERRRLRAKRNLWVFTRAGRKLHDQCDLYTRRDGLAHGHAAGLV